MISKVLSRINSAELIPGHVTEVGYISWYESRTELNEELPPQS